MSDPYKPLPNGDGTEPSGSQEGKTKGVFPVLLTRSNLPFHEYTLLAPSPITPWIMTYIKILHGQISSGKK